MLVGSFPGSRKLRGEFVTVSLLSVAGLKIKRVINRIESHRDVDPGRFENQ